MKFIGYEIIAIILVICKLVSYSEGVLASDCVKKETCGACIKTFGCVWCSAPVDEKKSLVRCASESSLSNPSWCPESHIVNPRSELTILEDKKLASDTSGTNVVQIKPQKVKLSLRLGDEHKISFQYRRALDYPVDIYYLMDLSNSMSDDKDKVSDLGKKLSTLMKNMTNNFRLGFGSFVDKPTMPYANTHPDSLKQPCKVSETVPCVSPYGFINHMPLNPDSDKFSNEVKKAKVSGNMDSPEGGLDALMQAMVCTEEIGWRKESTKMIIFSTDAGFHLAGDGKLAGIVEPNDESCHLDGNGHYTHSLLMDYPSISQIDKKAREKNVNIIFAVVPDKIYEDLTKQIMSSSIGKLTKDSSNVVDIVEKEYMKIVESVKMTDNAGDGINIKYYSKCLGAVENEVDECKGLKNRQEVNFTAVIKAVNCPNNKKEWTQKIEIKPSALSEKLEIELQIVCDCDCEQPGKDGFEHNSKSCNTRGNLQCGICDCNQGRYGRFCECDGHEVQSTSLDLSKCRANNETQEICSNFGTCKCNKCDCTKRSNSEEVIYGTYCECDNFSCKRNGGLLCSGPKNGRCDCGKCLCNAEWTGTACECRNTNTTCIAPNNDKVCSGHGSCMCGVCQCDEIDKIGKFRYSGRYCEECPHCDSHRCDELRHCVECQVHGSGMYDSAICDIKCMAFKSQVVEAIENTKSGEDYYEDADEVALKRERICRVPDNSGCTIVFKYSYEEDNVSLKVVAKKAKECSKEVDYFVIIMSVVGSVVFAGIVMLIFWKVATTVHDRREFAKFEEERLMQKWDRGDNPLYKPSTSTFRNPVFGQRTSRLM